MIQTSLLTLVSSSSIFVYRYLV